MSYTPTSWSTGDTITASALNKIENGIANAGGGIYDGYDYVIRKVGTSEPTLEKGTFSDIYDILQAQEPVRGLYVENTTIGTYYDTACNFVPFTRTNYYSSANTIQAGAKAIVSSGLKNIEINIYSNNSVDVSFYNG